MTSRPIINPPDHIHQERMFANGTTANVLKCLRYDCKAGGNPTGGVVVLAAWPSLNDLLKF